VPHVSDVQGFCHDVRPVEVSADFDNFDEAILYLVLEVMPFQGNMLGADF
jgi:hypothetical protein